MVSVGLRRSEASVYRGRRLPAREAKDLGDGHYLFTLDYLMYGAWDQLVTIHLGEKRYDLPLVIVAYP